MTRYVNRGVAVTFVYLSAEHRDMLDGLVRRLGYRVGSRKRGLSRLIEALIEQEARTPRLPKALPMPTRSLPIAERPPGKKKERRMRIIAFNQEGMSNAEIARRVGVTRQSVYSLLRRVADGGDE